MDDDLEARIAEAYAVPLTGWDFSFLEGRVVAEPLPWDYEALARPLVADAVCVLDVDTGGGEVFARLGPPPGSVAVEPYAPNLATAGARLTPLGVAVRPRTTARLPVEDASVDLALNRHGAVDLDEVARVLSPGGVFLTQQVGARNDAELNTALGPMAPEPGGWPDAASVVAQVRPAGLVVERIEEAWPRTTYLDVGAVLFQVRRVPWQVPGFDPRAARDRLESLHARIVREGGFTVTSHRLLLRARRAGRVAARRSARPPSRGSAPAGG